MPSLVASTANIKMQRTGAEMPSVSLKELLAADLGRSKDQISQIAHLGLK
jgi:hypothetical protein